MKNIKRNIVPILYILTIIIFFLINSIIFILNEKDAYINENEEYKSVCNDYIIENNDEKSILEKKYLGIYKIDDYYCSKIINENSYSGSVFLIYYRLINTDFSCFIFPYLIPLIVIFPILYKISIYFNGGYVKNFLLRDNYKKFIKKILIISYKYVFVVPIILIANFIISLIISKFNFLPYIDIGINYLSDNFIFHYNNFFFYVCYILVLILSFGWYANIALITISKNKNFLLAIIKSYILIYFIWSFNFIIVSSLFKNISSWNFNLLDIYTWTNVDNIYCFFAINLIIYIITLVLFILSYRNKEKLIILCER